MTESNVTALVDGDGVFVEPPFGSQIGLFITYRCPIRCRHCMVEAGPKRTEEVDLDEALDWIHQIASYRQGHVTSIAFTGGEPFICWDKLRVLGAAAVDRGLKCSVITNAYWANATKRTRQLLTELKPAAISLSTDEFHIAHIPLTHLRRVFEECMRLGIRCDLTIAYNEHSPLTTSKLLTQVLEFAPRSAIRMTRVFPVGRGRDISSFASGIPHEPASARPCLFASVPYILPDGLVRPCVGPIVTLGRGSCPLDLGSLRESGFEQILNDAFENPILQGVRLWGPRFLHELVQHKGPRDRLPPAYHTSCPCETCLKLMTDPVISRFLRDCTHSAELSSGVARARARRLDEPVPEPRKRPVTSVSP
jgi:organic radical activating enzyme